MGHHHLETLRTCREHLLQEEPPGSVSASWVPLSQAMSSLGGLPAHTSPGSPRGCLHPALPSPRLLLGPALPPRRRSLRSLLFQRGIKTNTYAGKCIAVVLEINN